ncbi:hypothetical protein SK128_008189 [Halocaridina rubra]|uniref:Uncharacterized protein n=1 Tax=Halocaridina rubra TaxID=373956 RepID=A0AAN8ZY93_HALRR
MPMLFSGNGVIYLFAVCTFSHEYYHAQLTEVNMQNKTRKRRISKLLQIQPLVGGPFENPLGEQINLNLVPVPSPDHGKRRCQEEHAAVKLSYTNTSSNRLGGFPL